MIPVALAAIVLGYAAYNAIAERRALAAPPEGGGTVEANEIEVGPLVGGRIVQVLVAEGDDVAAGATIAKLDDTELRAALRQAEGQRDAAANTLRNLQEGSRSQQIAAARAALAQAEAAQRGALRVLANAELGFQHAVDVRQQLDSASALVRSLTAQAAAAREQAAAAVATATGAERTLSTAQENAAAVTELQQQADAARGALDTASAGRDRAASAHRTAKADYDRIAGLFAQGATSQRDHDAARLALETARTALDASEAQLTAAQAGLRNATRALTDRLQAKQGVISAETGRTASAKQRDAAQALVQQAEANLAGARLQLANAQIAYEDRLQARNARDTAATACETTRHQVEAARQNLALLEAGNTAASIRAARGQLEAAEGAAAVARRRLAETKVKAPSAGSVATVVLRAGDVVSAGLPIVRLLDLGNSYVRVYLPFRAFGKVKAGQRASIETDALPGARFEGKVLATAAEAEFTPKNVETRDQRLQQVYWVKVGIVGGDRRLKPGMPAHATIEAG